MHRFAILLLLLVFALPVRAQETLGIFVGNQGPPSSITYVDPNTGAAQQLLVGQIGSFLQSMELMNGRLYVTAPGSASVDVIDPDTRQRVGQIQDDAFAAARYFAQVSPEKAYVTTQNYTMGATESEVVVLNLTNNTVAGRITVPVQPEGVAVVGDRAYVSTGAFGASTSLVVIDTASDAVMGSVDIGCSARLVLADSDGDVFAVCDGSDQVIVLDGAAGTVTTTVDTGVDVGSAFGIGQDAAIVGSDDRMVLATASGLAVFDTDSYTVEETITIPEAATRPVSAVGFDPERERFILGRPDAAGPFSANGTVTTHALDGSLVNTAAAGIFPDYVSVYTASAVANEPGASTDAFVLHPVYPNPFANRAALSFTLARSEAVQVVVFDALGREVAVLADGVRAAGEHALSFEAEGLPSGVYLIRIEAGGRVETRTITRLR